MQENCEEVVFVYLVFGLILEIRQLYSKSGGISGRYLYFHYKMSLGQASKSLNFLDSHLVRRPRDNVVATSF